MFRATSTYQIPSLMQQFHSTRSANIELQNRRHHRIIKYTQTRSNLDAAVPTQKQLYTCKTSNSISTKKQKSPWNLSSTVRQKVLSPRQSCPHPSRKRAYSFTILDLPSALLPIKSQLGCSTSNAIFTTLVTSSAFLSTLLSYLLQPVSIILYSSLLCKLLSITHAYIYIYSSQIFSAPLISPLPRLLYLFSTLFDSSHIVSPLLNSSCVFLAFLTSSHRCRNSYQLFPTSQLFSTRRHFSTLLCSSYFQVSARGLCYNTQMDW